MSLVDIIPGKGVGEFRLGMSLAEIEQLIPNHSTEPLENHFVIWTEQLGLWIAKSNFEVTQILTRNHHPSKVLGKVGLGDTLADIEKYFGPVKDDLDIYVLTQYPGVGFELEDSDINEEWNEQTASIQAISIFNPPDF